MYSNLNEDISKVLYSEEDIKQAVIKIAKEIENDYQGKNVLLIGLLKGAAPFLCDLARNININLSIDFMTASSYYNGTETSGTVTITKDISIDVKDKHIILIDDVADSGITLTYLTNHLREKNPLSVKTCALLDKPLRRKVDFTVDYFGIIAPNDFVVGYGMDYQEKYRQLPYIGVLKKTVYS